VERVIPGGRNTTFQTGKGGETKQGKVLARRPCIRVGCRRRGDQGIRSVGAWIAFDPLGEMCHTRPRIKRKRDAVSIKRT